MHSALVVPYPEAVFSVGACMSPLTTCLKVTYFLITGFRKDPQDNLFVHKYFTIFLVLKKQDGIHKHFIFFSFSSNKMEIK